MLLDNSTKFPYYSWQCTLVDYIQVSYALQSITTIQPMGWHCYPLLHWHINPKTSILFLQLGVQPPTQKYESTIVYSNPLLNSCFVHEPKNKQSTNLYVRLWLHVPLSTPPIFTNQAQKQCLNVHNVLHKHVQKHASSQEQTSLLHYNHACLNPMWKQEDKRGEAKRRQKNDQPWISLSFHQNCLFRAYIKKNQQRIHLFGAWPIPLDPHSVYT